MANKKESNHHHLNDIPQNIRQVIIDNKRLLKKIVILQSELQEKNRLIQQLKEEIDKGVIESTQQKLNYSRNLGMQISKKIQQTKQIYYEKMEYIEQDNERINQDVLHLSQQLTQSQHLNTSLNNKIQQMKDYLLDMMQEKDHLIRQLSDIVVEQQSIIDKWHVSNEGNQQERGSRQKMKKVAYIRKNQ